MLETDIVQKNIISALQRPEKADLLAITDKMNPATLALYIQNLSVEQQVKILEIIPNTAYVLEFLPLGEQLALAERMKSTHLVDLISSMHSDERADLYQALPLAKQQQVFA